MTKIETRIGNLLDVTEGHIVHGCNAQGVMGSGVALAVKKKYPEAYIDYRKHYETPTGLILGKAYPFPVSDELTLWNAITQQEFGTHKRQVNYDAVVTCFEQIQEVINKDWHSDILNHIHIPKIGAGLGGGNWDIIHEIIEQTVSVPVTLWVLE